ncbi:MAG: amidohydrolase family protein [Thermoanaerobaculia bacterium]|nr:amidohydrolase family protein [Thermoanaerobaculia bacterium]
MQSRRAIDCLFPILLEEWKQSWMRATDSPGELHCEVETAWGDGYADGTQLIAAMDRAGIEAVLATDLLAWSYTRQKRFAMDMTEQIADLSVQYPGRIYGLSNYDPLSIRASLAKLDHDITQLGFKGVYLHIYGFDIGLDHRKMYPLYAKCEEMGVPVAMQVGHVLEAMPSEHGRPMQLDRIACDFPDLTIIGTHTGYPWVDEMLAVAGKWPNVYVNIAAWLPKYFGPNLRQFISGRHTHSKVLFGTNGLDWTRYLEEFDNLGVDEDRARAILFDNPRRVYQL